MSGQKLFPPVRSISIPLLICFLVLPALLSCTPEKPGLRVVPRWGVAEFELSYDTPLENPFADVDAEAVEDAR